MIGKRIAHFSPGRALLSSFCITILFGTAALCLPWARNVSIPFLDILFTATSATCVTGLFTISLDQFSTFGHIILLILIQIGGLGLITLSIFLISLFINLGMSSQIMLGQVLEIESWKYLKRILFFTIGLTLMVEFIGAAIIYWSIHESFDTPYALFIALFQSISAFCNAGIVHNLSLFNNNYPVLIVTAFLVFTGGLGFVVWYEIVSWIGSLFRRKRYQFSLHSKIILIGSTLIIGCFAMLFWILEHDNIFAAYTPYKALFISLFHAISLRSSGFMTIPLHELQLPTIFIIMILCIIGSAPGSTGSGIKVTTFFIYIATIKAVVVGNSAVIIKGRTIPHEQVLKCIAIVSLSLLWIALATICLLITEVGWGFLQIIFEVISSFTTLGLSLGITSSLSTVGKIIIIINMIIGRIGSLTLIVALRQATIQGRHENVGISYPEERVMLS